MEAPKDDGPFEQENLFNMGKICHYWLVITLKESFERWFRALCIRGRDKAYQYIIFKESEDLSRIITRSRYDHRDFAVLIMYVKRELSNEQISA